MEDLQELIFRGRFILAKSPERLRVFELVNGKRSTYEIAGILKRHINNTRRDLKLLADAGLIQGAKEKGNQFKKDGHPVYEKVPLARTVPLRYFSEPSRLPARSRRDQKSINYSVSGSRSRVPKPLAFPNEPEVLQIAKSGEDQLYEFKRQGANVQKISREIAAMLNTSQGGMIFYGIDDSGTIEGSDVSRQKLDQPLQNSIRNSISPSATVRIKAVQVLGSTIIVILVPPWNRKSVYQYDEKVLVRKGTSVFAAKPDELKNLHSGKYVI